MKEKKKSVINYKSEEQKEIIKFVIILLVIVVVVVGIYFFTRNFVTKEAIKDNNTETTPVTINYDVTIVGSMLNRPYDEYYVLAYESDSVSVNKYQAVYSSYANKEKKDKLYYIDLSNHLNSSYYNKNDTNPNATSIDELKFGDFTLIKVKKGKIVKYLEDYDEIKKELKIED